MITILGVSKVFAMSVHEQPVLLPIELVFFLVNEQGCETPVSRYDIDAMLKNMESEIDTRTLFVA